MKALKLGLGLAAVIALASQPAAASAQRVVPPGNSAANQYTETLPGPGGNEPTQGIGHGGNGTKAPAAVIGHANAAKLEALGSEGEAAARLAAETAPERSGGQPGNGEASNPSGSSGLAQVLGQVTGSSDSGGMGLLLPLLIAMAIVAAAAYVLGRRRTAHTHD